MSENKDQEAKYNTLIDKLHKSTETLAGAIVSTPMGKIEERPIEIDDMDDVYIEVLDSDVIRESNRGTIFEIPTIEGVVYLTIERVKNRIRGKLPGGAERRKESGTTVDGIIISTKDKFKNKVSKLIQKLDDGDLKLPIKLNTPEVEIDGDKLRNIDKAIQNFNQECEDKEQEIWDAINSANEIGQIIDLLVENKIKL